MFRSSLVRNAPERHQKLVDVNRATTGCCFRVVVGDFVHVIESRLDHRISVAVVPTYEVVLVIFFNALLGCLHIFLVNVRRFAFHVNAAQKT